MLRGVASLIHIQRMHHPPPTLTLRAPSHLFPLVPLDLHPYRTGHLLPRHPQGLTPHRARTKLSPLAKLELRSSFRDRLMFRRFIKTEKRRGSRGRPADQPAAQSLPPADVRVTLCRSTDRLPKLISARCSPHPRSRISNLARGKSIRRHANPLHCNGCK